MKSRLIAVCAIAILCTGPALAQSTTALSENGWFSDDTRADGFGTQVAGTNLVSPTLTDDPEATASGNAAHDADILAQISFGTAPGVVPFGTHPGAVSMQIGAEVLGKSQASHRKDDGTGHCTGLAAFGTGTFTEYSWMGDGTTTVTASFKLGVKTADFGSTGSSSRTGENVWDKILIYEPGNGNGQTSDSLWHTETVDWVNGKWWFFDRTVIASSQGTPVTLSEMSTSPVIFSGTKTLADVYALITAPGAHVTSVQFGVGSYNAGASVHVNQLETNYYRSGSITTFGPGAPVVENIDTGLQFTSIQDAIDDVNTLDGDTLEMLVSDHSEGPQIEFTKDLTLRGDGSTILRPLGNTGTSGDARGWFLMGYGRTTTLEGLDFDGTGFLVHTAIRNHGTLTVSDCDFTEIKYNESGPTYAGLAISHFDTSGLATISDCTFSEIGRIGIHVYGPTLVERCIYTGKGAGDWLDYMMDVGSFGAAIGTVDAIDCTSQDCLGVASTDGSTSAGLLVTTYFGAGTEATFTNCTFENNTTGLYKGFDAADTSIVSAQNCSFINNEWGAINASSIGEFEAIGNWWGDETGPLDTSDDTGTGGYYNPGGLGDEVTDGIDYTEWLLVPPPCRSVPSAEDCTIAPIALEGPDLTNYNNLVVVHYNAGVTQGTANITNVAFVEIRNAQFATHPVNPDPENYALNVILPAPTSDGTNLPPALATLDSDTGGGGEPFFGGIPAVWTIDYFTGANTPGNLVGSRWHTVMFGTGPEGICDVVQTFLSPYEQISQTVLHYQDGIYHSVVNPEADLTTAMLWGGTAYTIPIPGGMPVEPFLLGTSHLTDAGHDTTPALLTGSADPGFVTVWTTAPCTIDTLASAATNRLALDIVDPEPCYKEDDIIEVAVNMNCLQQDVTGFFGSVIYDPLILELQATSAYTLTPFSLHIGDPIVDAGGGVIDLDGSAGFGDPGTSADALLATLYFKVLSGNDAATTAIEFNPFTPFPSELSFGGVAVATRLGNPLAFHIDQIPPAFTCPVDISVANDAGLCSALVTITPPVPTDGCGLLSIEGVRSDALELDDPYPAGCAPGLETTITWTATDCAGHETVCVQGVRVTDTEDPVLTGGPTDIFVNADAGECTAVVTYTAPTATDNCAASPTVVPDFASGYAFPVGTTLVTYTATDDCGNTDTWDFEVTVAGENDIDVEVELVGVNAAVSRCIHFVTDDCAVFTDDTLSFVDHDGDDGNGNGIIDVTEGTTDTPSTPVRAAVTIEVACGSYTALCAKDAQHTLWATSALTDQGTYFAASSVLSLEGGDTDNDGDVDINDVTLFLYQFGQTAHPGGCPWDGTRDADFSDTGAVGSEDYAFLTANWLTITSCACTIPLQNGTDSLRLKRTQPDIGRRSLRVTSPKLRALDFNNDRKVDFRDVYLFELEHGLPHTLSSKMQ